MIRNIIRPALFSAAIFILPALFSQRLEGRQPRLDQLTVEDGLSQSVVECILQDRDGYLWFGTQDGLNRYDGFSFKVYRAEPGAPQGLYSNWIKAILQDSRGDLWIGTVAGGLHRMDPLQETFTRYVPDVPNAASISHHSIMRPDGIVEDSAGHIWALTTAGGADRWRPDSGQFAHFALDSGEGGPAGPILKLTAVAGQEVVAVTASAVMRFDPSLQLFIPFFTPADSEAEEVRITTSLRTTGGDLLVGTSRGELWRQDQAHPSLQHSMPALPHPVDGIVEDREAPGRQFWVSSGGVLYLLLLDGHAARVLTAISGRDHAVPRHLFDDGAGVLWIVGDDARLRLVDKQSGKSLYERERTGTNQQNIFFRSVAQSRDGIMWLATHGSGIMVHDPRKIRFHRYVGEEEPSIVYAISSRGAAGNRRIHLGTAGRGLLGFDERSGITREYPLPVEGTIRAILATGGTRLWLGTDEGLICADELPAGVTIVDHLRHDPENLNSLNHDQVRTLHRGSEGSIWIGTANGAARLDTARGQFERFLYVAPGARARPPLTVQAISFDRIRSETWFGTSGGLYLHSARTDSVTRVPGPVGDGAAPWISSICRVEEPAAGGRVIWMGTFGYGLVRLEIRGDHPDEDMLSWNFYGKREGLCNSTVYTVLDDRRGRLWMTTNRGVSRYTPPAPESGGHGVFRNYGIDDGLLSLEFNSGASFRTIDGEILVGSIRGLNGFDPDEMVDGGQPPSLVLSGFSIAGTERTVTVPRKPSEAVLVELAHDENFFTLELTALDFTDPLNTSYQYMLEGFDEGWISNGHRRHINYTNVPPGEYVFRARAANQNLVWSEAPISFRLVIDPPFWRTDWFVSAALLLTASLILLGFRARLRLERRRAREIAEVRTEARMRSFHAVESARREERMAVRRKIAADFHDQSGHKLTRISLFCEVLRSRGKARFSREELGYLERIMDESTALHGDMTDFIWSLHPGEETLYDTAVKLKDFGDKFFDRTGIAFRVDGICREFARVHLSMDVRRNIMFIFKEGMNNVLKHGGKSCENVQLAFYRENGSYRIELHDDGGGIADANGGRGLNNMRRRSEGIGGLLVIDSHPGKGTRIRFTGNCNEEPPSE